MIKLIGHSGCGVELLDIGVVRKTASNIQYNGRLIKQMEKQRCFFHTSLKTPKILDSGYNKDGCFFFDMEYIKGDNLCAVFQRERTNNCLDIVRSLCFDKSKVVDIKHDIESKLKSLNVNSDDFFMILDCNWSVPSGYCHGDLTFENIIVNDNGIFLIDFLDSFVDMPIVDESKLLQDAFCYWSFRDGYIPTRKLFHVCEMFETKQHFSMLYVHLLRILPYANTKKKEEVLCMMKRVKNKINQY